MVSPFVLGTMNFGDPTSREDSIAIIERAVTEGINFIDTANTYAKSHSEVFVGEALKKMENRNKIFLATKVYNPTGDGPNDRGLSRYHIMRECENSLRRLGVDHIDLYQLHRPIFTLPIDETLRALDDLIRQGKVRYIGTSTYPAWKLMESLSVSEKLGLNRFVSEQPPYNLLDRRIENELLPFAGDHGFAVIPWSPMAGGLLSGKYTPGGNPPSGSRGASSSPIWKGRFTDAGYAAAAKFAEYARGRRMSPSELALLWVKDRPGITAPIIGPRTMEHLETALTVIDKTLSPEDAAFCDTLVPPGTAVVNYFNSSGWMKG
jgi:aryl-alcohol dehydrogenase-like predicted oxidoreductase